MKKRSSRLDYKIEWEQTHPLVYCTDPTEGTFCHLCQTNGKSPLTARGAWTSMGVSNWNHSTELLKLHNNAKWHRELAIAARMAEQSANVGNVADVCTAALAKQLEEERQKNCSIVLKLLRSLNYLAKNHIPRTTTSEGLV